MYNEFRPNPLLSPYIETYWTLFSFLEHEMEYRVLPDGCVDIIFSLFKPDSPYIVGTMTTFLNIQNVGEVKLVGVRFRPGGITAFTRVSVDNFTDVHTDLFSTESILDKSFYESLPENCSIDNNIVSYMDDYFLHKLSRFYIPDKRIDYAVSLIEKCKGNISIPLIAEKSCLSKRQLERRFLNNIGVSPKAFSRIVKFKSTVQFLKATSSQSLFETAVDCGYYDHAHLAKEFKRLSGYSPSEF
ncbi:helix-turn-helix domain-containing protein [Prevotella sp. 10(H)]|uniref:AraC family transcriptional regulator n=1 Tax=Prevotella sp. 10(H) TaxID=1158294 RepID=UPI0004A724BB|nr:helix-turn-helix domain-containing protein [Prevotella sp. 10(H)]